MAFVVETHDKSLVPYRWWGKFYAYVYNKTIKTRAKSHKEVLDYELARHNAEYLDPRILRFKSKNDYTLFLLRWS